MTEPWFNPTTFGALYGGVGGGAIGILGGVIGALASTLPPNQIGKRWLLGTMAAIAALGVAQIGFGLIALANAQPYGIWYPPLLLGFISSFVFGWLRPVVRRRYDVPSDRTAIGGP